MDDQAHFPQVRLVTRTPAPGVPAPWRQRAASRRIQVSCRDQWTALALSWRERRVKAWLAS